MKYLKLFIIFCLFYFNGRDIYSQVLNERDTLIYSIIDIRSVTNYPIFTSFFTKKLISYNDLVGKDLHEIVNFFLDNGVNGGTYPYQFKKTILDSLEYRNTLKSIDLCLKRMYKKRKYFRLVTKDGYTIFIYPVRVAGMFSMLSIENLSKNSSQIDNETFNIKKIQVPTKIFKIECFYCK
jgi:hypothetical protein